MKIGHNILLYLLLLPSVALSVPAVSASDIKVPIFPSCLSPQGELKVEYQNGIHGIVGEEKEFQGYDAVYRLEDGNYMQCFCADHGGGIQTNWWRISSLDADQINQMIKMGWIYVPTGASWGLDDSPYLAMNIDYQCKSLGSSEQGSNAVGEGDNSSGQTNSEDNSNGIVLTAQSDTEKQNNVLGLAATGGNTWIHALMSLSVALTAAGVLLKKRAKNAS